MNTQLPWAERFRPEKIKDIVSHSHIKTTFDKYLEHKTFPHLLFYGPPGTGKTSTVKAFARQLYGQQYDLMVLEINASEERGIDVVRSKIRDFVITRSNFFNESMSLFKLVILDEADAMTGEAQAMLRRVIEKHTGNARFCLICNYRSRIIEAIQSRCTMFKFTPLSNADIKIKVKDIAKSQNISIDDSGMNMLIKISNGDMRKLLNMYQSISILGEHISADFVAKFLGYPSNDDMEYIESVLHGSDINDNIDKLSKYIPEKSFGLHNIITELTNVVYQKVLDDKLGLNVASKLMSGLADIEINLCSSPNTLIQISAIASVYFEALHSQN